MDVVAWLESLGLARYAPAFRDHAIDAEILPELTDEHLKELGLPLGPRLKLLKAIAGLAPARTADAAPTVPQPVPPAPAAGSGAERRQLTVMFTDLVGSTALAGRLDPEDMGAVIRAYQDACAGVIARFEGHIAKYMGDGVLAYFGYPQAHEDDAERAVRAGLGVVEAIGRLAAPDDGAPLAARVGIATGLVVVGELVGEGAAQEQAVVGETPNLAARLQDLGAPAGVVIGRRTRELVGGLFELADLGPHPIKGFARPIRAWRVVGEGAAESRFEARHAAGLTPLVGREEELALLLRRWELAKEGEGQVVLLAGEPGIGKSRLVRALRERLGDEPHTPLSHYCSPFHRTSALHPVIGLLERAAGFARDDPPERKLDKLEATLTRATEDVREVAPLLAALLAIPAGERYPPLTMSPQRQKERTLAALIEQLAGLAARRPVLALYEDVHWSDPTTLELMELVVDRVPALPILVLITFRPEFTPPWTGHAHVTSLALNRLGRRQGALMVDRVTGGKALPAAVLEQIVAKTDGVPLFVEELTKALLESGLLEDTGDGYVLTGPLPPLAIPATLQDSLMARLDRLAPVKEVAQIGAAIGREFSYELLAAVAHRSDNDLDEALSQLTRAELVFRRGTPPDASYSFKHALVQDAAYQSLLRSKRQELHARIAQALEERFPDVAKPAPELLARHCTEAGLVEKAVDYWHQAGQLAIRRSAVAEAVAQLRQALDLLPGLPDDAGRRRRELDLQVALGGALAAVKGYGAPETGRAYARARELCAQAGDTPQIFRALYGQAVVHHLRAEFGAALEASEELLRRAQQQTDSGPLVIGHRITGTSLHHLGRLGPARAHLERALALYDPARHRSLAFLYAEDPRVAGLSWLSWTLSVLGHPEQALARSHEALGEARQLAHRHTAAYAQVWACIRAQLCRDRQSAQALADEVIALATEQGFPLWLAAGTMVRGWSLADAGQGEAGLGQLREGLGAWQATGAEGWVPYYLALTAEACGKAGRTPEGLSRLTDALARVQVSRARWIEAELHRLGGELLLSAPEPDQAEAETSFRRAVEVAREQDAKLWELRAATSLARLWRDQGRRAEAYKLLAPVYAWFTEGFDTTDLENAKALLDELGWTPASPAA